MDSRRLTLRPFFSFKCLLINEEFLSFSETLKLLEFIPYLILIFSLIGFITYSSVGENEVDTKYATVMSFPGAKNPWPNPSIV
jgi:hypothetical protein